MGKAGQEGNGVSWPDPFREAHPMTGGNPE
jgi:hypothetical protein